MKNSKKEKRENSDASALALIREQADRIAELKRLNADLALALEDYRLREKAITDALNYAQQKSAEILAEAKVKYALECERIKAYRKKWIAAVKSGALQSSYEQTEKTLLACQKELETALASDLGTNDYIAERERLDDDPSLNYEAIIDEENEKISPETKSQIEDLSDEELEDLLRQI